MTSYKDIFKGVSAKRFFQWTAVNGMLSIVLYFALFRNNDSAMSLIKFAIWFSFITNIICALNMDSVKKTIEKKGKSVPSQLNFMLGIVWCSALAWFGFFGYAAMEIFGTVIQCTIIDLEGDDKE